MNTFSRAMYRLRYAPLPALRVGDFFGFGMLGFAFDFLHVGREVKVVPGGRF